MRLSVKRQANVQSGIALIMVMMVITVLGLLAFGFAKSMSVETKLARNATFDSETEWLGRSGVEFARYFLGQHMTVPNEGSYDALNQKWAGGPMGTNDILANLSLEDNHLGAGTFSVKIIDLERFYNINLADDVALRLAMDVVGVDPTEASTVVDSILDWRDTDDNTGLSGAESDYYMSLSPPYMAKNGPIDDIEELLRIKGVTPEMFYGPSGPDGTNLDGALPSGGTLSTPANNNLFARNTTTSKTGNNKASMNNFSNNRQVVTPPAGLRDLFTPISARVINVNTASVNVLRLIPGLDENIAQSIIQTRAGPDGVDGTEDDTPFKSVGELASVPGFSAQGISNLGRLLSTRSATFKVTVTIDINNRKRDLIAILRRNDQRDVRILMTYWK